MVGATIRNLAIGAGIMYFYDPQCGRQRRERLGDALADFWYEMREDVREGVDDVRHRVGAVVSAGRDAVHEGRRQFSGQQDDQPGRARRGRDWSPATRILVGTGGALLLGRGLVGRGPGSMVALLAGMGLLGRSIASCPATQRLVQRLGEPTDGQRTEPPIDGFNPQQQSDGPERESSELTGGVGAAGNA